MNQKEARVTNAQEQAWAMLRNHRADIERIADGKATSSDANLILAVFGVTLCDMIFRESEADARGPRPHWPDRKD